MATTKATNSPVNIENDTTPTPVPVDDRFEKTEEFVDKNKKFITILIAAVLVISAGVAFYFYQNNQKNKEAQVESFGAVYYFEADSLDKALKGDGKNAGLLEISEEYGSTKTGKLANYYIGVTYLKKGKFEEAIEYLKKFDADDILLKGRALSLIGDAYMEQKDLENAVDYYKKAANYHPNEYFTPRYLIKLALAQELSNDYTAAIESYNKIIEKYYKASEVLEAKKYKALAEGKVSK